MNQLQNNHFNFLNNTKTPNQGLNFQNQPALFIQLQFAKQNKTPSQFPIFFVHLVVIHQECYYQILS